MKLATHPHMMGITSLYQTFTALNLDILNGGICLTTMALARGARRAGRTSCWPGFCCLPIVNTNLLTYHHPVGYKGCKYCLVLVPFSNLEMHSTSMSSQPYSVAFCSHDNGEIPSYFHKLEARFLFHASIIEQE